MAGANRGYSDLQEHLEALDSAGLLLTVDEPVNKDTEMVPLVRWQFRGGLDEDERRAFLFRNVTDSLDRRYDIPVVIGALAANRAVYSVGMQAEVGEIPGKWDRAIADPIPPRRVNAAPARRW